MSGDVAIRSAVAEDEDAIWSLFQEVMRAGDAFAFDETTTREDALRLARGPARAGCRAVRLPQRRTFRPSNRRRRSGA